MFLTNCTYAKLLICIKMDLALNNLRWLICHKNQPTNQPTSYVLSTICNLKMECMYELKISEVDGESRAHKLRIGKMPADLSVGRVICYWQIYKQIQRQMVLQDRRKKEKPWTRLVMFADFILTDFDLLHWFHLALLELLYNLISGTYDSFLWIVTSIVFKFSISKISYWVLFRNSKEIHDCFFLSHFRYITNRLFLPPFYILLVWGNYISPNFVCWDRLLSLLVILYVLCI